jgi:hypothetical protein
MRMPLALLAMAALLAFLTFPSASAGSLGDPEAPDARGDAKVPDGCFDLLAAWAESDPAGAIRLHAVVASCGDPPALGDKVWWGAQFTTADGRFYVHGFYDTEESGYRFWTGAMTPEGGPKTHEKVALTYVAGSPAQISFAIPSNVTSLEDGESLEFVAIDTGVIQGWDRSLPTFYDEAKPLRPYVHRAPVAMPSPTPAPVAEREPQPQPPAWTQTDPGESSNADPAPAPATPTPMPSPSRTPGPPEGLLMVGLLAAGFLGRGRWYRETRKPKP